LPGPALLGIVGSRRPPSRRHWNSRLAHDGIDAGPIVVDVLPAVSSTATASAAAAPADRLAALSKPELQTPRQTIDLHSTSLVIDAAAGGSR
jgi:hypothetical protein